MSRRSDLLRAYMAFRTASRRSAQATINYLPVASADVRHGYHACKLGAEQRYTVCRQLYRWELAAVMVKRTAQQSFASGCGNVAIITQHGPRLRIDGCTKYRGGFLSFCQRRENDHSTRGNDDN